MKLTLVAACLVLLALVQASSANFLSDEFIDLLNKKAKTWTARRNFPKDTPISDLKKRLGALPEPSENYLPVVQHDIPENYDFPETFNAIDEWPNCTSLEEIRDQGTCGSCWAISSAEVMTDRHCIHSDARENFHYSTQDLVSCCHFCGFGCDGGWPAKAFQYWVRNGVVSGGPYNSHEGCYPYEITNTLFPVPTPACKKSCQSGYSVTYEEDKQFSERYYRVSKSESSIMQELMKNGPVVAAFDVYEDFYDYSSGVYKHTHGDYLGGHAIKILGFGVELGTPYWLCANSWGASWGEKGFFKILRGSNECYIENSVDTGLPKYEK